MTLGTSQRLQRLDSVLEVEMNGITLEESSSKSELLLGCCISSNLKWHCQINQVLDRLKKRIAALETIKNVVDFDTRKRLTEGLFTSIVGDWVFVFIMVPAHVYCNVEFFQSFVLSRCQRSPACGTVDLDFTTRLWYKVCN